MEYLWSWEILECNIRPGFPKGVKGGNLKIRAMNFTRCSGVADESKKKDLKVNVSNFETCTIIFGVADEKQKSKKS